jgi:lipopolysaccharide transport system ATP-binding protein
MICGTVAPTRGSAYVNGRVAALLELGAGFNLEFTGRENVYTNGAILGLSRVEVEARFHDIAKFAEIGDFMERPVKTYSSGMFVRLAFAIQANIDPDILIIDEALAVGDAYFIHRCMNRIQELKKAGKTIILVTHDATAVRQLCTSVIWMDYGKIREIGPTEHIVDKYLADIFLIQKEPKETQQRTEIEKVDTVTSKLNPEGRLNFDARYGDRTCEIIDISVRNLEGKSITSTYNDSELVINLIIRNNHNNKKLKMCAGYTFRNSRGVDISSSDTIVTKSDLGWCNPGDSIEVSCLVKIPIIHPDFYSIIPSAGYFDNANNPIETDRIVNAFILEVLSREKVNLGLRFYTEFSLQG